MAQMHDRNIPSPNISPADRGSSESLRLQSVRTVMRRFLNLSLTSLVSALNSERLELQLTTKYAM